LQSVELSSPLISVVICTYNRVDTLVDALKTICNQTLDTSNYEIIVVDNNSSDNTAHVAKDFCERFSTVRYCLESKQGLSHARNRGWQEAKGEYVAYIDDDCKIPEQFLAVAKSIIERISPVAFGGPGLAFYNSPKPRWYKHSYGSQTPFKEARILKGIEITKIYGMNMFFRRSALQASGGFDPKLGMIGDKMAYYEETAVLLHIAKTMPEEIFYYDPALYVYHLVQEERMSFRWFAKAVISLGRYSVFCNVSDMTPGTGRLVLLRHIILQLLLLLRHFVRGFLFRNRTVYVYYQNYLHECTYLHLFKLGKLYAQYQQMRGRH
jgi:glucosyl-dolichyl phosphate glucuronosyltransferase